MSNLLFRVVSHTKPVVKLWSTVLFDSQNSREKSLRIYKKTEVLKKFVRFLRGYVHKKTPCMQVCQPNQAGKNSIVFMVHMLHSVIFTHALKSIRNSMEESEDDALCLPGVYVANNRRDLCNCFNASPDRYLMMNHFAFRK